jgi:hypothetical protein
VPVVVDDILIAFAKAVGTALGKQIAKELFDSLFGTLATKEDLRKAVIEIEAYTHQEFDSLRNDILYTNVTTGISQLKDYNQNGDTTLLTLAYDHFSQSRSWIDSQRSKEGDDFLRTQYAAIVQYVTADIALWVNYGLNVDPKKYKSTLIGRIDDHIALINQASFQVNKMETESTTSIQVKTNVYRPPHDPGDPIEPTEYSALAWYDLYRGSYAGGSLHKETGWLKDAVSSDAVNMIKQEYDSDVDRIHTQNQKRIDYIYDPVSHFSSAMTSLKNRLLAG